VALEEAIVGSADVTFASGNVTLTLTDTNASQTARNLRLNLTGTTGGARDLIVPAIEKIYIVNNGCADTVTIKVTGQTGVAVPAGKTMYVYNNATDCTDAITHLRNLTLDTALPVASGGTGANTLTAESVVVGNGTNAVKFVAPGTSTNVLTSNGTAWVSQAAASTTNANAITTGILSAGVGGTGANTLTSENVIIGNGTSAVKFVAPGTTGNVLTSNGTVWLSQAAAAGGGDYTMQVFTSPGTYTKPAGLKAIKVTVIGGGSAGNASPGTGGTSSFGSPAFLSATGGSPGAAGAGSGGTINVSGGTGGASPTQCSVTFTIGGAGAFGFGAAVVANPQGPGIATAGRAYGGAGVYAGQTSGGGGGAIEYIDAPSLPGPQPYTVGAGGVSPVGATGGAGVVIVEEFY
jgi:hypothetical protein